MLSESRGWLRSLWLFSRPHTIIGTVVSVLGLAMLAAAHPADSSVSREMAFFGILPPIAAALIAALSANIYIVGLNQLTDIGVDRINKPHLPLASGLFSLHEGRMIVAFTGLAGLVMAASQDVLLLAVVALSMAIGTVYSLPPLRLKRFPFWAALCIFGVRGVIVNLGFYAYFRLHLQSLPLTELRWLQFPAEVWALTAFVVLYALAIALFKDIPDLEGDRRFSIRTLTVRLGPVSVFRISMLILICSYALMLLLALAGRLASMQPLFFIATQSIPPLLLLGRAQALNLFDRDQIKAFYQFIWKLFFVQYLLFPLAGWLPG